MMETIAVFLIGLIPGMLSAYILMAGMLKVVHHRRYTRMVEPPAPTRLFHPGSQSPDFRYIEGLGYIVGDLSCEYNARSPYLRCAVNPAGSCNGCPSYTALQFPDEPDDNHRSKACG